MYPSKHEILHPFPSHNSSSATQSRSPQRFPKKKTLRVDDEKTQDHYPILVLTMTTLVSNPLHTKEKITNLTHCGYYETTQKSNSQESKSSDEYIGRISTHGPDGNGLEIIIRWKVGMSALAYLGLLERTKGWKRSVSWEKMEMADRGGVASLIWVGLGKKRTKSPLLHGGGFGIS